LFIDGAFANWLERFGPTGVNLEPSTTRRRKARTIQPSAPDLKRAKATMAKGGVAYEIFI
jgi:hypothetical protein